MITKKLFFQFADIGFAIIKIVEFDETYSVIL